VFAAKAKREEERRRIEIGSYTQSCLEFAAPERPCGERSLAVTASRINPTPRHATAPTNDTELQGMPRPAELSITARDRERETAPGLLPRKFEITLVVEGLFLLSFSCFLIPRQQRGEKRGGFWDAA